ncbi:metallophosphoesterase [Polymorphospora rubra]|uniref:metallophosphoesterase family protein n=1 Tax=Polymorphospora rubra TaxID=338584 RepID=UPI0033E241B4
MRVTPVPRRLAAAAAAAAVTLTGLITLAPTANAAVDAPGLELLTSDIDPAQPRADVLRVAVVSDFGACGYGIPAKCADQNAVADMIHSWNPDFILTGGDNNQQQATEEQVRLSAEPYMADIEAGKFFPIFGNHDFGNTCDAVGAQYSMQYFKVPLSYRAVLGNGLLEWVNPNGACQTSNGTRMPAIYDDYLATVQNSRASWVLTGVHQPPYSSGVSGNNINRRWAIQPQVDLLISGHDHHTEHIITPDGDNLVLTGNGGDGTTRLFTPTTGSQWRDNKHLGAMRLTITPETLRAEFVALGGETQYEFTLGHDADGDTIVLDQSEVDPGGGTDPNPAVPAKREVSFDVAAGTSDGLTAVQYPDGPWTQAEVDGRRAIQLQRNPMGGANQLYLQVDDAAMSGGPFGMEAEVTYRSPVAGSFNLQHENAAIGEAYSPATPVAIAGSQVGTWQTATIPLPAAAFNNRQNGGSDLRLTAPANLPLAISAITIRSTAPAGVTARMVAGQEPDGLAPVEYSSGPFTWGVADGRQVLQTLPNPESTTSGNLYMAVDDRYLSGGPQRAWLVLTYLPQSAGRFQVQYENAAVGTTYYNATAVEVTADQVGTWQTTTVDLPDAAFNNRQNGAADFRLRLPQNYPMAIAEMRLTTIDPANTPDPPTEEEPPTIPGSVLNPVSWSAERAGGLDPIAYGSGPFTLESDDTGGYLQVQRNTINSGNNLYLTADDAMLYGGPHEVWFTVEYRSPVEGRFELQYEDAVTGAAYLSTDPVTVTAGDVGVWKSATWHLPAAQFQNRQNGGADLRLRGADNLPLQIRSMRISPTDPAITPPQPTGPMTIRDTSVTARVPAKGNAVAQVVLTLQCSTDKPWCRERVTVTYEGETIDSKQVTIEADASRQLTLNFRGGAREALRAGADITLDVQIGDATSRVTVTPLAG